jgi:hypothetical protein
VEGYKLQSNNWKKDALALQALKAWLKTRAKQHLFDDSVINLMLNKHFPGNRTNPVIHYKLSFNAQITADR